MQINQIFKRKLVTQTKNFLILVHLLKKHFNVKITEIESKIPNISGFAINAALTAVENKIEKADYNSKISDIESKYINTVDGNEVVKYTVDNSIESKKFVDSGFISNDNLDIKSINISNKSWIKSRAR